MKAVHQWATYHSNQSECLPEVHLSMHLSAVGFRICPFSPLLHTAQTILMRVHVFGWRARVLLTFYLEREWNLIRDAALLMWFPLYGHIHTPSVCCEEEAAITLWMLQWGCFTIQPLLSPSHLLLPNWLQDLLTRFNICFDRTGAKILPAALQGFRIFFSIDLHFLLPDSLIII